jgi:predicted acylesterase/phospholipase RssA
MSEWLVNTWGSLSNEKIYHEWPEGLVLGILHEQSALNDAPLLKLIQGFVEELGVPKRRLVLSAANVNTGGYETFYEDTPIDILPHAVVASGSIPFIFPP